MSKIFRLYKEGPLTYEDWNSSPAFPYNSTNRDSIEDPDGASASHEITSIPSPFARIDLIKTAFKEVCKIDKSTKKALLDGKTIFHKMVSNTLDVAEIFFNIDKVKGKVEVIKWNPNLMLSELENSNESGHQYLADALRKYMSSDAKTYNFSQLKNIYILNYTKGPDELNIIGATSPATLFFSSANDLGYVNDIFLGEHKPFDSEYTPLYKRDFEFVKYLFTLRKTIGGFSTLFPEIESYLSETFKAISNQAQKDEINAIQNGDFKGFETIDVEDERQNDVVEVLGYTLYKKGRPDPSKTSDFTIKNEKNLQSVPLVLPIESGNKYSDLWYVTGKWGNTNKAAYKDEQPDLNLRNLPYDGSIHPYLTISDLLEDSIVKAPHILNTKNYFDGHLKTNNREFSFLLPIKPLFFRYFSTEDLRGEMNDGKKMFEMEMLAGDGVNVTLRVPIKGTGKVSYIEYKRTYYKTSSPDIINNSGNIVELHFTGFIMPLVRFNNESDAIYNVSCIQSSKVNNQFQFFKNDERLSIPDKYSRFDGDESMTKASSYIIKGANFDYVQVENHRGERGIMVPMFKQQRNIESFEFAVDLGTSNTHIEYRKGNESVRPFAFTEKDRQLCEMFIPRKNNFGYIDELVPETEVMEKDFIPSEIGSGDFKFPTRTVLSSSKNVDWNKNIDPYISVNLPFTYDKRSDMTYNNLNYNIKWGEDEKEKSVLEAYIRCLMLIMRNKVLLNNGDLAHTQIKWFYPISMPPKRLGKLKQAWKEAYEEYFGIGEVKCMTESAAPIMYFFDRHSTATSLVNVDIGGGTTDVAFAQNKSVNYVTSFRFASNDIFENSFSNSDNHNGIVDYHKEKILGMLNEYELDQLIEVFKSESNARPSNMASFLFGLKDNSKVKEQKLKNKTLDFNYILQEDEDFKIIFIVFYTSIIYHIAQIIKHKELEMPRHISFSGNGSKVLRIITTDADLLARYTKLIFEKVLEKSYDKELELVGLEEDSNPKGSTCKGGILGDGDDANRDNTIVLKGDCSGIVGNQDTYDTVDNAYKGKTISAVKRFFDFVFEDMNKEFNFDDNFGVNAKALKVAKEAAQKDLDTFLNKGISQRQKETETNNRIEETFFFYPIKGALQTMSMEINNKIKNK